MENKQEVEVSLTDKERLIRLKVKIEDAQAEISNIIAPYLGGYNYKVSRYPPAKSMRMKSDYEFIDDGNGHCGVYDYQRGVCEPIEC